MKSRSDRKVDLISNENIIAHFRRQLNVHDFQMPQMRIEKHLILPRFFLSGDSFFEYLVKSWLQSNRTDDLAKRMFDEALEGIGEKLLERSPRHRLLYVAERKNYENIPTMHHLACFAGGMFVLGMTDRGRDAPQIV